MEKVSHEVGGGWRRFEEVSKELEEVSLEIGGGSSGGWKRFLMRLEEV